MIIYIVNVLKTSTLDRLIFYIFDNNHILSLFQKTWKKILEWFTDFKKFGFISNYKREFMPCVFYHFRFICQVTREKKPAAQACRAYSYVKLHNKILWYTKRVIRIYIYTYIRAVWFREEKWIIISKSITNIFFSLHFLYFSYVISNLH